MLTATLRKPEIYAPNDVRCARAKECKEQTNCRCAGAFPVTKP
jgi:hypothetical protein